VTPAIPVIRDLSAASQRRTIEENVPPEETVMQHAQHAPIAHRTLDRDHALALATLCLGAAGLVLLAFSYVAAAWVGLVGGAVGGYSQLVSETRPERFENIIGITAAALALAIGLARGGLTG
jgi:hypothetical protein